MAPAMVPVTALSYFLNCSSTRTRDSIISSIFSVLPIRINLIDSQIMTIHEPAAISDENSPTKETTYSACGCKGIRYCRLCVNSERVARLQLSTPDKYSGYKCFVFNPRLQCTTSESNELPFYSPLIATNVNPKSSVEEIAQACCSTNVGMDLVESITGLTLITNFLTESEEQFLLERIDERPWIASQSGRRKQVGVSKDI